MAKTRASSGMAAASAPVVKSQVSLMRGAENATLGTPSSARARETFTAFPAAVRDSSRPC